MIKVKKYISMLLVLVAVLQLTLNIPSFSAGVTYSDPGLLESSDEAFYEPYPIALNATSYTPWFTMYHMQTQQQSEAKIRGGEGGQMIMSYGISPVNPNLMLKGTDMGGIWRSTDGGKNWSSVSNNVNMRGGMDIQFHPEKENVVFCVQSVKGIDSSKLGKTQLDGLYRSTDGGITWEQVLGKTFLTSGSSHGLVQFDAENNIYALSSEGLYKSVDEGENWNLLSTLDPEQGGVFSLWVSDDGRRFVAGTESVGVSYSTDGGITWEVRNASLSGGVTCVAVNPVDEAHWYAAYPNEEKILFESKNCGKTWQAINYAAYAEKNKPNLIKPVYFPETQTVRLFLVYREMSKPIRYSDDGGKTWKAPIVDVSETFTRSDGYYVEGLGICESNPNIVLFSYGDVTYKSTDGGTNFLWANAGYSGNYANSFEFDEDGKLYIAFTDRGIARTDSKYTKGKYPTLTRFAISGTIGDLAIDPNDKNHLYVSRGSWSEQVLYETKDGGESWNAVTDTKTGESISYTKNCGVIEYHAENSDIIYAGNYKSENGGSTWVQLEHHIWDISPLDSDILYSVDSDNAVIRSTDGGENWIVVREEYSAPECVLADNTDKDTFWVGCYSGVILKCSAQALEYTKIGSTNGLEQFGDARNTVCALAQNPKNPQHLLAGTTGSQGGTKTTGLFETYDGGETWHVVKGLSSTRNVKTLQFSPVSDEVFIGTCSQGTILYDYGIYQSYISGNLTVDKSNEILLPSDSAKVRLRLNGETLSLKDEEQPYVNAEKTYMPLKKIMERGGYDIKTDQGTAALSASKEYVSFYMKANSNTVYVDGKEHAIKEAPVIKDGVIFVTDEFFTLTTEFDTAFDDKLNRIEITYNPAVKVTFKPGSLASGHEDRTYYVENGTEVILEDYYYIDGYELIGWQDAEGNIHEVKSGVTVYSDCEFTAVWKRSDNAAFFQEASNTYYPTGAVFISEMYNEDKDDYNYSVDYASTYTSSYNSIMDNINITEDSTAYKDSRYLAYRFNLSEMNELTSVTLRLQARKVVNAGYLRIYGADSNWDNAFGTTGVYQGNVAELEDSDGFPKKGNLISEVRVEASDGNTTIEADITDYFISEQKNGEEYAVIYVEYNLTKSTGKVGNGCRLYNLSSADETIYPQIAVKELYEISNITSPGRIYAEAAPDADKGMPVIAFYKQLEDGTLHFQKVNMGNVTDDIVKKIYLDIEFNKGEKPVVKFFIWNNALQLVPLMNEQSIYAVENSGR